MPCPPGWEAYRALADRLAEFTASVLRAADAVGAACMLENPAAVSTRGTPQFWQAKAHHGSLFTSAAILHLRTTVDLLLVDFAQCAFGAAHRKWTSILYSRALHPFIAGWRHLGCAHGFDRHPDVAYGRDELGASKSARAAAYPRPLNQGIAAVAAAFITAHPRAGGPPGVGRVADGADLSPAICNACDAAAANPPRFSSYRNLRPASDEELRTAPLPQLLPPLPAVPRRDFDVLTSNPWPPGWEERRPISIEQLHKPGVYEAYEEWLADGEIELLNAAIAATLPESRSEWQAACRLRRAAWGDRPAGPNASKRSYTIPASDLADGAADCIWDSSDRNDCFPLKPSSASTVFPGAKQIDRDRFQMMAESLGWTDFDLLDQILGGGLEARTSCPRETVVNRHHPGFFVNFAAAAKTIASDISEEWVRPPPPRAHGKHGHLPTVPCHADPRDVIMRLLSRVVQHADGTSGIEDYFKARVSSNLSAGGDLAVNAGTEPHDRAVTLPNIRGIGLAGAVCDAALVPKGEARVQASKPKRAAPGDDSAPAGRARAGFYALDLASAYRYVCLQLLDLWCHCFMYLDADGHVGICVDTRLCFGGAYGPNRFERITTLAGAYIIHRIDLYDAMHPYPPAVESWEQSRALAQAQGLLPASNLQLRPRSLCVYLDDFAGSASGDPAPPPVGYPALDFDRGAMLALGLRPAAADTRLVGHATIAAGELQLAGFGVATDKTMIGYSIISLGLLPDVIGDSITCPGPKQRLLLSQADETSSTALASGRVERKTVERLTGRLCNISQLFPEIGAELGGGYRVANARRRGGSRALLDIVSLPPSAPSHLNLQRMLSVARAGLTSNTGVALAPASRFAALGSPGVLAVTGDASGDIAGGDAGLGGFTFDPSRARRVIIVSELWPEDIALALAESALEPHLRSGGPRLSMPAAELFTSWACAETAIAAGVARSDATDIVAISDCQPACGALNRASSPVAQLQILLTHARALASQWLGVHVPRELNLDADVLSHPSRVQEVLSAAAAANLLPELHPVPAHCWLALRAAIAASSPTDADS
jgi:hypothetical protein